MTYKQKFLYRVYKTKECWYWCGRFNVDGYGNLNFKKFSSIGAHRVSWMLFKGPIPKGMKVCHKCDNPPCVRPGHLFIGTQKENVHDSIKKGRQFPSWAKEGWFNKPGTRTQKLTGKQVLEIRARLIKRIYTHQMAAIEYGVSKQTISEISIRKTWK